MNFTYIPSNEGKINVGGSTVYNMCYVFRIKFKRGSIVYSKDKALIGIAEKHCIKDVRIYKKGLYYAPPIGAICNRCDYPPLYIDTQNAYFNEEELISPEDAADLIQEFHERTAAILENTSLNAL